MNILAKNLLILASAGSGKTFQLGNRVIGLIAMGVPPEKIVALTFTRKAAGEFADSVLTKLADAATDPATASRLRDELGLADADFTAALGQVVRSLPRFTLGTMDSFFSKIVRGFQYELGLTGGKFDLLEGPRAAAAKDDLLAELLGATLESGGGAEFLHAFRRATIGREGLRVMDGLRKFVDRWQSRHRAAKDLVWGPPDLAGVAIDEWEIQKHNLAAQVRRGLDGIEYTRKGHREAFEKAIDTLEQHTIGSGSLSGATGQLASILENADTSGPLTLKYHKEFIVDGPAGEALREMPMLAARCELAAALSHTRAVREVVAVYDKLHAARLRDRGRLGFEDVKLLMGEWAKNEDARLRREAVDFRLDARHEHWLLDEFQDTSRADWLGLLPLVDEAASEGEGSLFIVGDRKQAIYGWRGGDVRLFDDVRERYTGNLAIEPMTESWRSCPQVLDLVNRVCGDRETLAALFGGAEERWEWQDHVSAAPLQKPEKRGEARVEIVDGKWEDQLARMAGLLNELGVGRRNMSCGVLLRSNTQVAEVADFLRAEGFDVIEEGRREPAKDNPVGVALWHLFKWLADPADAFASEIIAMSPLSAVLADRFGTQWVKAWEGLHALASDVGFAAMTEELIEPLWHEWSDFGRRRAGDILSALAALEAGGTATARDAADWLGRLEVSQSPGIAAVQVMTIHKSKGLGFDVVVLPDVPDTGIPSPQYFEVAESDEWITETPPLWARKLIPAMREAEEKWSASQRYEAFCALYVALTRAKRGLYVLLPEPPKKPDFSKPSLANWLSTSIGSEGSPGIVFQSGSPDWVDTVDERSTAREISATPALGPAVPRRERITPARSTAHASAHRSSAGSRFGREVHAAFEHIGWIDEAEPSLQKNDASRLVSGLLATPEIRPLFERRGRAIDLLREQPVDAVIENRWLTGVIDRLHLHRDPSGAVTHVEIIDFKTDAVAEPEELLARHASQMDAYRTALAKIHPAARIDCLLVSTRLRQVIAL